YIPIIFSCVIGFIIASGCVPARKQTYLTQPTSYEIPISNDLRGFPEKQIEYILQPGDVIRIQVSSLTPMEFNFFDRDDSNDLRIDPILSGYLVKTDGNITLPFIGEFKVEGMSIIQAQKEITKLLGEYLDTPTAIVRLVSFDYTVIGEVNRQGKFAVLENRVNILEAIGSASGLTEFGDFENVKILRSEDGKTMMGNVNLLQTNLPTSPFYYLQPNDVVIVDQLQNKNFRRNSASNIALILSAVGTTVTLILAIDRLNTP
ncbi:MAG: polysaccharide biosynthesis/export family protein, partial [Cyclobacteriaceae bacterium]